MVQALGAADKRTVLAVVGVNSAALEEATSLGAEEVTLAAVEEVTLAAVGAILAVMMAAPILAAEAEEEVAVLAEQQAAAVASVLSVAKRATFQENARKPIRMASPLDDPLAKEAVVVVEPATSAANLVILPGNAPKLKMVSFTSKNNFIIYDFGLSFRRYLSLKPCNVATQ